MLPCKSASILTIRRKSTDFLNRHNCSNDVQGTLNHEHTKARNMVIDVEHADCGPMKLVNTPMKFSESKPGFRTPPPVLGQHTAEVLSEHLGLSSDEINSLKEQGVVR